MNQTPRNKFVLAAGLLCALAQFCMSQSSNPRSEDVLAERLNELSVQLPAEIKQLDRGAVRVFLRLRLATLLWSEHNPKFAGVATALTIGGLEDLDAEKDLIPAIYATQFRRDLIALLEIHAATLAKKYKDKDPPSSRDTIDSAYSLLNTQGQENLAINMLKRHVTESQLSSNDADWEMIELFLSRLQKDHPDRLPDVLFSLMSAEENKPGTVSVRGFFYIAHFYLDVNSTIELKRTFVAAAIKATAHSYLSADPNELTDTYDLLRIVLPLASSLAPNVYSEASAQMSSLMVRLSRRQEREEIESRIKNSDDPLGTMVSEAKAASDIGLMDELLSEAAQESLAAGKLELALEAAMSLSPEGKHHQWRDQFLAQLVKSALDKEDPEFAASVISKIDDRSTRATALQMLSSHFQNSSDPTKATNIFSEELRTIDSVDDKTERAVAFLRTLPLFLQLNDGPITNFTDRAIAYVNAVPGPPDSGDREANNQYISKTAMPLAWRLLHDFQLLSERDESTALAVLDQIQRPELRLVARLGGSEGRLNLARANMSSAKGGKSRY